MFIESILILPNFWHCAVYSYPTPKLPKPEKLQKDQRGIDTCEHMSKILKTHPIHFLCTGILVHIRYGTLNTSHRQRNNYERGTIQTRVSDYVSLRAGIHLSWRRTFDGTHPTGSLYCACPRVACADLTFDWLHHELDITCFLKGANPLQRTLFVTVCACVLLFAIWYMGGSSSHNMAAPFVVNATSKHTATVSERRRMRERGGLSPRDSYPSAGQAPCLEYFHSLQRGDLTPCSPSSVHLYGFL